MGYYSNEAIDTRTCGEAAEDARADRADWRGPILDGYRGGPLSTGRIAEELRAIDAARAAEQLIDQADALCERLADERRRWRGYPVTEVRLDRLCRQAQGRYLRRMWA